MSQLHLDGFLSDLRALNPDFRASTSSLKGLINHLQSTVKNPTALLFDDALGKCSNRSDPRLDKYKPAIKRLTSVWGKGGVFPYPPFRTGARLSPVDINRICFRGDDRPPEKLYLSGFTKQDRSSTGGVYRNGQVSSGFSGAKDYVRHPIQGTAKAGDLDPTSAVCVTPDINVAALFPLPTTVQRIKESSWIYMVYASSGFNTYGRQVMDALEGLAALTQFESTEAESNKISKADLHTARVNDIMQNLYGRELAVDSVAIGSIWGAFKVKRTWTKPSFATSFVNNMPVREVIGADYKEGGTYVIEDWSEHEFASYPNEAYRRAVQEFVAEMKKEIAKGTHYALPTTKDGFVKASPFELHLPAHEANHVAEDRDVIRIT